MNVDFPNLSAINPGETFTLVPPAEFGRKPIRYCAYGTRDGRRFFMDVDSGTSDSIGEMMEKYHGWEIQISYDKPFNERIETKDRLKHQILIEVEAPTRTQAVNTLKTWLGYTAIQQSDFSKSTPIGKYEQGVFEQIQQHSKDQIPIIQKAAETVR